MNYLITLFAQGKINAGQIDYESHVTDVDVSIASVLNTVYLWAGIVAVLVIVVAGFFYITSGGNASNTKRAREAIIYAIVGLGVVLMAFVITQFVIGRF